jgi:hypothetical protein
MHTLISDPINGVQVSGNSVNEGWAISMEIIIRVREQFTNSWNIQWRLDSYSGRLSRETFIETRSESISVSGKNIDYAEMSTRLAKKVRRKYGIRYNRKIIYGMRKLLFLWAQWNYATEKSDMFKYSVVTLQTL